jgi:hypothetical protein
MVDFPIKSGEKYLKIKINAIEEKIEYEAIKKIAFKISGATVEYHNMLVYNNTGGKIQSKKRMLLLAVQGKVNLYIGTLEWSAMINAGGGYQPMVLNGISYYCLREGEPAAKLLHENFGQANKNADFKLYGSRYFVDNATILNKIKNKEYTYEDIMTVINEYNK